MTSKYSSKSSNLRVDLPSVAGLTVRQNWFYDHLTGIKDPYVIRDLFGRLLVAYAVGYP